jgi:hypothetical protein
MSNMYATKPKSRTAKPNAASAKSIVEALLAAKTPAQKGAAKRKLNAFVAHRVAEGHDRARVVMGVKSVITRIANQMGLPQSGRVCTLSVGR